MRLAIVPAKYKVSRLCMLLSVCTIDRFVGKLIHASPLPDHVWGSGGSDAWDIRSQAKTYRQAHRGEEIG